MTQDEELRGIQIKAAEAERRGIEAQRVLDLVTPYLDKMEKDAFNLAVTQQWQHAEGESNTKRLLERVSVIRALKVEIGNVVDKGKSAVQHLEQLQRQATV